jgi:hypothetical protein
MLLVHNVLFVDRRDATAHDDSAMLRSFLEEPYATGACVRGR